MLLILESIYTSSAYNHCEKVLGDGPYNSFSGHYIRVCITKTQDLEDVEVISEGLVLDKKLDGMRGECPFVLSMDVCLPDVLVRVLLGGHVQQFDSTLLIQGNT